MLFDQSGYQGGVATTKGRVSTIIPRRAVTGVVRCRGRRGYFLCLRGSRILEKMLATLEHWRAHDGGRHVPGQFRAQQKKIVHSSSEE